MEKIDIAAVGTSSEIYLFNAVGITTIIAKTPEEAEHRIDELSAAECKVVYLEEELYLQMGETISKYKVKTFPIIIPIPSQKGSKGVGMKKIKDNVEKAIGMDIL